VLFGEDRRHFDEIGAVGARRGVRAQLVVAALGPMPRLDGAQISCSRSHWTAGDGGVPRFVIATSTQQSAILRRARNSSALTLARVTPRTSAISSCDEPCAYASHNICRCDGLSCASARRTSVRCAARSAAPASTGRSF